ncbi:MAG: 3-phosphoshikimate 1-carboxyvinyltransferase [Prolixibacteraceae bacterium]|nr:3-phosphoshikimate 1-carboxyvinyltransferase [Prolixibacteraceae bacterium]
MIYLVTNRKKTVGGTIRLPSSKSISNRVLIINALSGNSYPVHNLSDSDDTLVLAKALKLNQQNIDIGHAGTAMRFLTAFLSRIPGKWEITGSDRMKQRPVKILVDALIRLGAKIEYLGKEGFPPIKIYGSPLKGRIIELDGSISSQYISALLMIAPVIEKGLEIKITGDTASGSYIKLTLNLMQQFGIKYKWTGSTITVPEQKYVPGEFKVEADWSGASYWYQILATAEKGKLFLENLKLKSLQGDSVIASWFEQFGIISGQHEKGIIISKSEYRQPEKLYLNFNENPDIAQTMACLCVSGGIPFHFSGLKTLKIKETDRISALQNELAKFGALLTEPHEGELKWDGYTDQSRRSDIPVIKTYRDHRMAMAFAPMASNGVKLKIEDPAVVTKSYPMFWNDLKKTGFEILPEEN